ncbi:MAG: hypothetical protein AMXMBFR33_70040 [Candidatus Xenobia bacterium]
METAIGLRGNCDRLRVEYATIDPDDWWSNYAKGLIYESYHSMPDPFIVNKLLIEAFVPHATPDVEAHVDITLTLGMAVAPMGEVGAASSELSRWVQTQLGRWHWTQLLESFNPLNFRHLFNLSKCKIFEHHVIPQADFMLDFLKAAGVKDPIAFIDQFVIGLPKRIHDAVHIKKFLDLRPGGGLWNKEWYAWAEANVGASVDEIVNQAHQMIKKHNLESYLPYFQR